MFEAKLRTAATDKTRLNEEYASRTRRRTESLVELQRARTELESLTGDAPPAVDERHDSKGCLMQMHKLSGVNQFLKTRQRIPTALITSSLAFSDWGQIFQGERLTAALLDQLTHHAEIFEMNGESFRFKESMKQKQQPGSKD